MAVIKECPKRILALDGGGIRGTLSLGFLEKVESTLRADLGKPEMVLSDYFDLIAGTSTGAIIAGALAIGMPVEKITEAYLEEDRQHVQYGVNETHLFWSRTVPGMLMTDINVQNQLLLQCISRCPNPALIDQQIGSAVGELVGSSPLLTYVRYDAKLETNSLNDLGFSNLTGKLESLRDTSAAENREILLDIGRRSAAKQILPEHFPEVIRLPE
jgi:hypothetical protein